MKRLIPFLALLCYLISVKAYGQGLLPYVEGTFTNNANGPLALGKICTTISGGTTSLPSYPTYADAVAGTNANANPVVLDAFGRANIWLPGGTAYRITIYPAVGTGFLCNGTAVGTAIKTIDGVTTGVSIINAITINGVQMCDQYPGSTAGAKIAACIAALPTTGGIADATGIQGAQTITSNFFNGVTKPVTLLLCNATYTMTAGIIVSTSGVRIIGCGTNSTSLNLTSGAAASAYAVTADLSGVGPARPLSFEMSGISINGDSTVLRTYNGLRLFNVYHPIVSDLKFRAVGTALRCAQTYYGTFTNIWFEHFTTGISGQDASFGCNANTFTGMNFFEGNVDDTAVMIDGTYMDNNTYVTPSFSAADAAQGAGTIITGTNDTYISPRFESIVTAGHWMTVTSGVRIINPTVGSSIGMAAVKYLFDVTGDRNVIDVNFNSLERLVKLESTASENQIHVGNDNMQVSAIATSQQAQSILDLGTGNCVDFAGYDFHCDGNSWSQRSVTNLATRSADLTVFALTNITLAATTSEGGPVGKGGVYTMSLTGGGSVGDAQQGISATQYDAFVWSFWVKARGTFGGNAEHNIKAAINDNPLAALQDVLITSAKWTRVTVSTKMITLGGSFVYATIQLPIGHPGIYIYGPQVVNIGNVGAGAAMPPVYTGGYVPTFATTRMDPAPSKPWLHLNGAPTGGAWARGERTSNLAVGANGIPGYTNTTGGTPGTWQAEAALGSSYVLDGGAFTIAFTNTTNIAASAAVASNYFRIGDRVYVYGTFTVDPTAAAPTTSALDMSLPVASNFTATSDAYGVVNCGAIPADNGEISAVVASDLARFNFQASSAANRQCSVVYSYLAQ